MIIHLSKPIEDITPKVNPNVRNGLWVIMICLCRFSNYNKCTILMENVDNGKSYAYVRQGYMGNLFTFLSIRL